MANTSEDESPLKFSTDPVTSVCTALISTQQAVPLAQGLDLPSLEGLSEQEASKARALLVKYQNLFAKSEADLGCSNLISHDIHVMDDIPVRQPYRRLPPSQYEVVKAHIRIERQDAQGCLPTSPDRRVSGCLKWGLLVLHIGPSEWVQSGPSI